MHTTDTYRTYRDDAIRYLQARQLGDGGFFFAQVEPSGGQDTYFAVETLTDLRASFDRDAVVRFWKRRLERPSGLSAHDAFWALRSLEPLGVDVQACSLDVARSARVGGALLPHAADLTAPATLDAGMRTIALRGTCLSLLYHSVYIRTFLGEQLDATAVLDLLAALRHDDGGFGTGAISDTFATLDALRIYRALGQPVPHRDAVAAWLRTQLFTLYYLEYVYSVVEGLHTLGEALPEPDAVLRFVAGSRRNNGGFARSDMGIATIEHTHQAAAIMRHYGAW